MHNKCFKHTMLCTLSNIKFANSRGAHKPINPNIYRRRLGRTHNLSTCRAAQAAGKGRRGCNGIRMLTKQLSFGIIFRQFAKRYVVTETSCLLRSKLLLSFALKTPLVFCAQEDAVNLVKAKRSGALVLHAQAQHLCHEQDDFLTSPSI